MSRERILIVEDEPVDAHGLEYRLTTEGFQVDLVETGKAALEFVKDNPPHLILLDLRLPDINGADVYRKSVCREVCLKGFQQAQPAG